MLFSRRKKRKNQDQNAQAEQTKQQNSAAHPNINPMITAIQLTGEQLTVEVTVNGSEQKKLSSLRLKLKNMQDSSDAHSFPAGDTIDSTVRFSVWLESIPFIQKEGKWSLYLKDDTTEYRLSPSNDLLNKVAEMDKFYAEGLITETYVTVKENMSIRTIKDPNEKPFVESNISDVQFADGILHLAGDINQHRHNMTGTELLVQKRGTELEHRFSLGWTTLNTWSAAIDLNSGDFRKGTWDYYLMHNQGRPIRIKTGKAIYQDEDTPAAFYKVGAKTVSVTYYTTIKGSFSTKHGAPAVHIFDLAGSVTDNRVRLTGELPSLFAPERMDDPALALMDRDSNVYAADLHINRLENSSAGDVRNAFETVILYDECMKPEKIKLDAYLKFTLDGEEYLFRIQTVAAHSITHTTQVLYDNPGVWHVYFYSTINENLSLAVSRPKLMRDVSGYRFQDGKLMLFGYAYFEAIDVHEEAELERKIVIEKRNSGQQVSIPIKTVESDVYDDFNDYRRVGFEAQIPLEDILSMQESLNEIYGLSIQVTYKGYTDEKKLRCENYTYIIDTPSDMTISRQRDNSYFSYLLFTPGGSLKLETYCYANDKAEFILNGQNDLKSGGDVWLIGERPETAQDTGYHFFKYVRNNHPEIDAYYVIDEDSPDLKNIRGLGNVVYFGTMEHLKLATAATKFIGSHDLEYLLPTKAADWPSYQKGKRIFLQHGILGRKRVDYFKNQYQYPFDMFCVSSEAEFNLVTETMGYDADEVKITGLSRFDQLNNTSADENIIAIIPTWRDWLGSEEQFLASAYFQNYKQLLTDKMLLDKLAASGTKIQFFPHYRVQPFINHFKKLESEYVKVIALGQINIQNILQDCSMLLTDYSSLSFDVNYIQKPVVFYHFDFDRFFKKGILRPKEDTFLGNICTTHEQVVNKVSQYIENGFLQNRELEKRINENFAYRDKQNNKRIFEAVTNLLD